VCTPNHMGARAEEGDWIIGTEGADYGSNLIYAMQLSEDRMHFDEYFTDERFQEKKPVMNGTWRQRCGDNFYYTKNGKWRQTPNLYHMGKSYLVSIHKWGILSYLQRQEHSSDVQPLDKRTLLVPLLMIMNLFYLILANLSLVVMHSIPNRAFYQALAGFNPLARVKRFAETIEAHT
jgi:Nucleotide modification associated domain 2